MAKIKSFVLKNLIYALNGQGKTGRDLEATEGAE
jgi:hypothetical protein